MVIYKKSDYTVALFILLSIFGLIEFLPYLKIINSTKFLMVIPNDISIG